MHSIDLIPADYRRNLLVRKLFLFAAAGSVAFLLLCTGTAYGLNKKTRAIKQQTEHARLQYAMSAQQREQIERLDSGLAALDQELSLLRGLRSGAAAEDLFVIIDRALPADEVWFIDWQFRRAGVLVPETANTVHTGYFIVIPAGSKQEAKKPWQVETHMKINGQASDHAALSRFVRRLFEQPEVQDVKLNRTQIRRYANLSVVDFDLAVVLFSDPASPQ